MALWSLDPWGEQRADMRMAQTVWSNLAPHSKERIDANDFRLFPDEAHELPDDVTTDERAMMLKLGHLTE